MKTFLQFGGLIFFIIYFLEFIFYLLGKFVPTGFTIGSCMLITSFFFLQMTIVNSKSFNK